MSSTASPTCSTRTASCPSSSPTRARRTSPTPPTTCRPSTSCGLTGPTATRAGRRPDRQFWSDAATAGRTFFTKAANGTTGLVPDYAEFSGAPNNTGNHGDFRFDAWRTAVNWSVDYAWFADNASAPTLTNRLQSFFEAQGVNTYANQFSLAGSPLSSDRSPGLIASNAAASLAATDPRAWDFVQNLWNLQPPTGQYRYYDGLLNFMALLHTSGHFRIYQPTGTPTSPPPTGTPTATPSATPTTGGQRDAYTAIEAESYDAASGAVTAGGDGGTVVSLTGAGSYLAFNAVRFGTSAAGGVQLRISTTTPGVNVNIRLGSSTAGPACTVYPDSNGTFDLASNSCYPKPTGTATVYLTVTGPAVVNSFTFTG